jgi:flagellar biosynthesis protein FlhG
LEQNQGLEYDELMNRIIPIASGKGGVGKSTITANLGILLASTGRTVVVVDLDLGASNLHTLFGISNTHEGISRLFKKASPPLEDLLVSTSFPRLYVLLGDNLIPGTANIPYFVKKRIITNLERLPSDFVLVDLGSGTHTASLDFFLMSHLGLIVTAPETTAILNAYSFIKNAAFRMIQLLFPSKHPARKIIHEFGEQHLEGAHTHLGILINNLVATDPQAGQKALQAIRLFQPGIIINMVRQQEELVLGTNLNAIIQKHLNIQPSFLGILPWEDWVRYSVNNRLPLAQVRPQSPWVLALSQIARGIYNLGESSKIDLAWDYQDLPEAEQQAKDLGLW